MKKSLPDNLLTIYGRNPVLEALRMPDITINKLHLSNSNKPSGIINDIRNAAEHRKIPISLHSRENLSRISGNRKQDQGVALDVILPFFSSSQEFIEQAGSSFQLMALDNITNPQNCGMIIRSVLASGMDGIIIPRKGCASIGPLVIKASAGTVFSSIIIQDNTLEESLLHFRNHGATIAGLDSGNTNSVFDFTPQGNTILVAGNETDGLSDSVSKLCQQKLAIPMRNSVESLNVATAASIAAFALAETRPKQADEIIET
jgi:23S rRNA (guanosine2251-2'-O)-methyltransferase